MKRWRCKVCGYIHTGDEPPDKCPVCGAPASAFELLEDEAKSKDQQAASGPAEAWKCQVCGHIHNKSEPPQNCPVCNAPAAQFEATAAEDGVADADDTSEPTKEPSPSKVISSPQLTRIIKPLNQLSAKADLLTKLHGHPIAVHIPNGVLPVTLLFTFLAVIFKYEPLAIAAKYNCILVALSMPLVLVTGYIDWFNRFGGHLTTYFKIKITCGVIVTALTVVLALWWAANPQIYLAQRKILYPFLLVNIMDFISAAVAGFYGGKLVFKE